MTNTFCLETGCLLIQERSLNGSNRKTHGTPGIMLLADYLVSTYRGHGLKGKAYRPNASTTDAHF